MQADIVRLLQPDSGCLTCVGDDAQAIYAFRGADPEHLRQLAADLPRPHHRPAGPRTTGRSRRCCGWPTRSARSPAGLELALTAAREAGAAPLLVRCHDEATQAREICARVLEAHEAGTDLRDQAVLVRAAHHSDVLEIELTARGIPFVKYGGLRFTEAAHVKDFLAAARVVANPADDVAWFRLLRLHEGIGPATPGGSSTSSAWPIPARSTAGRTPSTPRPGGPGEALAATIGGLAGAVVLEPTGERAAAILAALAGPLQARYPDADIRIADLSGSPTRRPAGRPCTTRWSSWPSTRRSRPPTSPGRPG